MRVAILTPVRGHPVGSVSEGYHDALMAFCRDPAMDVSIDRVHGDTDLVRARSRMLHLAYSKHEIDGFLWWDEDVIAPPEDIRTCLQAMIASGHDLVAAPVPMKRQPGFSFVQSWDDPRAGLEPGSQIDLHGCTEIHATGLGFVYMKRSCVRLMYESYPNLEFNDINGRICAPFLLMIDEKKRLLSEDFSFCHRWRQIHGRVMLYVGPGTPLGHVGSMIHRG